MIILIQMMMELQSDFCDQNVLSRFDGSCDSDDICPDGDFLDTHYLTLVDCLESFEM